MENIIKWQKEIDIYKRYKTMFVIEGNINDLQINIDDDLLYLSSLDNFLYDYYKKNGYDVVVFFNHIDGFFAPLQRGKEDILSLKRIVKDSESDYENMELTKDSNEQFSKFGEAVSILRKAIRNKNKSVCIIMNLASRYITSPTRIQEAEQYLFSELLLASKIVQEVNRLRNMFLLVCDKANDIPSWLYLNNVNSKNIFIPKPDKTIRKMLFEKNFTDILDNAENRDLELRRLVDYTDGFALSEIENIYKIMTDEDNPINDIERATFFYKHGIKDNPWADPELTERLPYIKTEITKRVKGQEKCIDQAIDIIYRSILGLSGLQHSSSKSKPRGILFLSGPTGTGKTELVKSMAEWLFGVEDACIRFDMSEFQQAHSDQRLLGAPPGYIGYEEGGQLTNAVKEKPFTILLFDEIEKAHPSILDKFLQILEDGRMTDGKGETVYFSDCLIVFTSNLGIYKRDPMTGESVLDVPKPTIDDLQDEGYYFKYRDKIIDNIRSFFTNNLGRPEILNRIGENFIVFEYISNDVAKEIANMQINKIVNNLKKQNNITLIIDDCAMEELYLMIYDNLDFGGRGVGNVIEKYLINPLSRIISLEEIKNGQIINNINIKSISKSKGMEYSIK